MPGQLLRVLTVGAVAEGKSTLIGRLQPAGSDSGRCFGAGARRSADQDRDLRFTDGTGRLDQAGLTATASADVAVIVADPRTGIGMQTKRHLAAAALLGVRKVVLAVNKMDLIDYDQELFALTVEAFGAACAQLELPGFTAVPVAALPGENVVEKSGRMPWFQGAPLLGQLRELTLDARPTVPARLPVQTVIRPQTEAFPDYRGYSGRVEAGPLVVGGAVTVLPSGRQSSVLAIDTADGELAHAHVGRSVTVRLADDLDVARGDMIVACGDPAPRVTRELTATLCWWDDRALVPGARYRLRHTTRDVLAIVEDIESRLDFGSLTAIPADRLECNDIGIVGIRVAEPIVVDPYLTSRATGAFLLVDAVSGATVATGLVR
jgi:sulfate adenylyltransferase subunit 1